MRDSAPTELNWVEVCAGCIPAKIFTQLRYEVENDVKVRSASITQKEKEHYLGFLLEALGSDFFVVNRGGANLVASVQFKLERTGIVVTDDSGKTILVASPTINDEGRCVLSVSGTPLEHWQIRRLALEKLFFDF